MNELMTAITDTAISQAAQRDMAAAQQKLRQAGAKNMATIEEAAKDFEAMFLSEMLRPMFDGIKPDPLFGGGKGEEVFQSLMIEEYGKSIVEAGGIGLAEHVKAELIRLQEEAQK